MLAGFWSELAKFTDNPAEPTEIGQDELEWLVGPADPINVLISGFHQLENTFQITCNSDRYDADADGHM